MNWPISGLNDLETQERGLQGVKIENISLVACLDSPRRLRLRRSFRKSLSIYPRSAPTPYTNRSAIRYGFRAGAVASRYGVNLA